MPRLDHRLLQRRNTRLQVQQNAPATRAGAGSASAAAHAADQALVVHFDVQAVAEEFHRGHVVGLHDAQLVGTGIFLRLLAQRVGVGLADQALHLAGIAGADRRCLGGLAGFVGRCLGGFGSLLGMAVAESCSSSAGAWQAVRASTAGSSRAESERARIGNDIMTPEGL